MLHNNKKPLRIAMVTNLYESIPPTNKGGLEQMVHYLTEELVAMGHKVTVFGTADSQTSAKLVPLWPKAVSTDPHSLIREMGWYADLAVSYVLQHANEFDVIHDHTYFVGARYGHLVSTPLLTTMHHPVSFETGLINEFPVEYRKFAKLQDQYHLRKTKTIVVSEFQKRKLALTLGRESCVIHNGIPSEEWSKPNISDPGEYVAYLGYISGNKGVAEAIQGVNLTNQTLKIAGPIDQHDSKSKIYFKERIEPFVNGTTIQYLGAIDKTEKKNFLRNAKAVLMPIQWDEPFGLVAIESLAMGTPVIAWNRGALPEIIENGVSGFLVNSINEMADKITHIDKLSRAHARAQYEKHFTAQAMAEKYVERYYTLINKKTT